MRMKKINSNSYAHRIIGGAALFLLGIPACLYILRIFFALPILKIWGYISCAIGALIILFFVVLLSIEFHQDRRIHREYAHLRKTKVALDDGRYECQACGNTRVSAVDTHCKVCGMRFQ